jgi:hypothetical protein
MNFKLILVFILIFFNACSKKVNPIPAGNVEDLEVKSDTLQPNLVLSNCPNNGNCSVEILKNKSINIKEINGGILFDLSDNERKTVIQYQYSLNQDKVAIDGGYSESIIFEIDNVSKGAIFTGKSIQDTKMLFGRFCRCRDGAGFFKVYDATLDIKKIGENIDFELDFNTGKIPQVIKKIVVKNNKLI